MAELNRLGEAGLGGSEAPVVRASSQWLGWTRTWRFFVWTWTIDTGDSEWLVETVQRRFLGEEVTHRYSRVLWMVMAWSVLLLGAAAAACMFTITYLTLRGGGVESSVIASLDMGCLLLVLVCAAVVYFTFIPPKEYRQSRNV